MAVKFDVELKGPLWKDSKGKVLDGIGDVLQAAIEAGEQRLDETLRPRPSGVYLSVGEAQKGASSKGNYRHNVQGKLIENQHALITDNGVVYGPWLEGESSRNAATRFKGYHAFRKVRDWLEANIHNIANNIDIAKRLK